MTLREQLQTKRANYARTLQQCDIRVLQAERDLLDAKEARAGAQVGLQVLDETIQTIDAAEAAEKQAAAKPVGPVTPPAGPTARNTAETPAGR